jgi:Condensation domain
VSIIENPFSLLHESKQHDGITDHFSQKSTPEAAVVLEISGELDTDLLQKAAEVLFGYYVDLQSETARTRVGTQLGSSGIRLSWHEKDLLGIALRGCELHRGTISAAAGGKAAADPALLSFTLIALEPGRHHLVFRSTHFPNEGAMSLLLQTLFALYEMGGEWNTSSSSAALLEYLTAGVRASDHRTFWNRMLEGLEGPTYLASQEQQAWASYEHLLGEIPEGLSAAIQSYAQRNRLPLGIVLQGSWGILLSRMTGNRDVVFGITLCDPPAIAATTTKISNLMNARVPVRMQCDPAERCSDVLVRLQNDQARMVLHRYLSLHEIEDEAGVGKLFDTCVVFQKLSSERPAPIPAEGFHVTRLFTEHECDQDAALWIVVQQTDQMRFCVHYSGQVFDRGTVELLVGRWKRVLEEAVERAEVRIGEIEILSEGERRQVVEEWNRTERESGGKTIAELFAESAERE